MPRRCIRGGCRVSRVSRVTRVTRVTRVSRVARVARVTRVTERPTELSGEAQSTQFDATRDLAWPRTSMVLNSLNV